MPFKLGLADNTINSVPTSTTTPDQDQQPSSLSSLLMDIGSSSPSTTSSLAVTSLATYASLGLDDQFDATTTLSSSSSTVTTNQTVATGGQQPSSTTAILNNSANNSSNTQANNASQLPPVSTFILPHFRDSNSYWWESNKNANSASSSAFNYTGHNLQTMDDEPSNLTNVTNSNGSMYFPSLDQYSTANGSGAMSNNYDYQYNGYHSEPTAGEYSTGFTSLASTLSN